MLFRLGNGEGDPGERYLSGGTGTLPLFRVVSVEMLVAMVCNKQSEIVGLVYEARSV